MKKSIILIITCTFFAAPVLSDVYYVVNKRGEVVAKSHTPFTNVSSLESRGEKQVVSAVDLDVNDAVVESGQVKERTKSQAEKNAAKAEKGMADEEKLIVDRYRKLAIDSLKAEGVKFKYVTE